MSADMQGGNKCPQLGSLAINFPDIWSCTEPEEENEMWQLLSTSCLTDSKFEVKHER